MCERVAEGDELTPAKYLEINEISGNKVLVSWPIDSFHMVTSLNNRSSIEESIKSFLKMKGQIAY